MLSQQWYPLVITDWQMPVMDGIALTETLRGRGLDDTFVIMLTMRGANIDYERGYLAGVDDYLTKKAPDAELFARIHAAFNTLALRRSLKETQAALEESVSIDAASGAFAPRELYTRLHSELRRAQRYGRQLAVIVINVVGAVKRRRRLPAETLRGVVQTIDSAVRAHVDWVGRLDARAGRHVRSGAARSRHRGSALDQGAHAERAAAVRRFQQRTACLQRRRGCARPHGREALQVDAKEMLRRGGSLSRVPGPRRSGATAQPCSAASRVTSPSSAGTATWSTANAR